MKSPAEVATYLVCAFCIFIAYLYGRDVEAKLTIQAYESADYARAVLERCVVAGEEAMAAVMDFDGDLRDVLDAVVEMRTLP